MQHEIEDYAPRLASTAAGHALTRTTGGRFRISGAPAGTPTPPATKTERIAGWVVGALILATIAVVTVWLVDSLGAVQFWMDEFYTWWFAQQTWHHLWFDVARYENHPQLYYMVAKAFMDALGSSEAALRTPSLIAWFGLLVVMFEAGRTLGRHLRVEPAWLLGLLAAALCALLPPSVAFAGDARPYAFAAFATALMLLGALKLMTEPARTEGPIGWHAAGTLATLAVGTALTLWSHSLGLIAGGATGLVLAAWWAVDRRFDRRTLLSLVAVGVIVAVLCVPLTELYFAQAGRDYSNFWLQAPSLVELVRITIMAIGPTGLPGGLFVAAPMTVALCLAALVALVRLGRPGVRWALALLVVVPLAVWGFEVAYTFLSKPVILTRTLVFVMPPVLLLYSLIPFAIARRAQTLAAALALVAAFAIPLAAHDPLRNGPVRFLRDVVAYVSGDAHAAAPILVLSGPTRLGFDYYTRDADRTLDIRPIPFEFPLLAPNGLPDLASDRIWAMTPESAERIAAGLGDAPAVWTYLRNVADMDPARTLDAALVAAGFTWRPTPFSEDGGELRLYTR